MVAKTEGEWRRELDPMQFRVLREKGTEHPFSHPFHDAKANGMYTCVGCGAELFSSESKYDSGTGWPSFWQPIVSDRIATDTDYDLGDARTEVMCAGCGGHLGHVFNDGPAPTHLRYCMNGVALKFEPAPAA